MPTEIIESKEIYRGFIALRLATLRLADGARVSREIIEHGKAAAVLEGASVSTLPARAPRKAASQAPKCQTRDLPCPICKFKTTPHHDGRMNRSQETKKPFTVEELMERHLAKVG